MSVTFYPTISYGELGKYTIGVQRALLPASSWAGSVLRRKGRIDCIPVPKIPHDMTDTAADCGGFVATRKWGEYKYSPAQYVDWCEAWRPTWAATMDFCCENEITTGNVGIVRERQNRTTDMAYHFWQNYKDAPWTWVPTLQGWTVEDYLTHVGDMKDIISEMHAHYGVGVFRVGIGTLCRRANAEMIATVVEAIATQLPTVPLHLWGVKLSIGKTSIGFSNQIVSIDSGAWNGMWGDGRSEWKRSPYSQREWCFRVALPRYEQKVQAAFNIRRIA